MANKEHASMVSTFGLVLLVVLSTGCGSDATVDNAEWRGSPEVTGSVTLDGASLSAVTVSFETAENTFLVATTDAAGKFTLDLGDAGESAIGKYAVRIHATAGSDSTESQQVPARYNEKTELVVDILDGKNNFDFRLESTGSPEISDR